MPSGLDRQHPSRIGIHLNCIDVYDIEDAFGLVQRVRCWPDYGVEAKLRYAFRQANVDKVPLRSSWYSVRMIPLNISHMLCIPLGMCALPYPSLPFPCYAHSLALPCNVLP